TGTTWLSEAKRLRDKWGVTLFVCDPARPDAIHDLATNSIPTIAAYNDVYLGIRRVAEAIHPALGLPGMRILDQCKHLVSEMRSYQWKQNRNLANPDMATFAEVPADNQADHACDALRYATVELRPYVTSTQQTTAWGQRRGPIS